MCFHPDGCLHGGYCYVPGVCSCTQEWTGLQCEGKINLAVQTHFTQSGNSTPPQLCVSQSVLMVNASTLVNATAMLVTKELAAMSISINIVCSTCIPLVPFHILAPQIFVVWLWARGHFIFFAWTSFS